MPYLKGQGFDVIEGPSFKGPINKGRTMPDIAYRGPDGRLHLIEIKTGNADLTNRQAKIYPLMGTGHAIPTGNVARRFGLTPGIPLSHQGYPDGIPVTIMTFPGVNG